VAKHLVAGLMAELVVDGFEVVEVDEAENAGALDPAGNGQGMAELLVEAAAIEQAGEFILIRQGFQGRDALALLVQLLLGLGGDDQRSFQQLTHVGAHSAGVGTA
jgi:hypothetical protein